MVYTKAFFDLQLEFARRVADIGAMPFTSALLDYTNFYVRFVGDRRFDADHPVWRAYLDGFERASRSVADRAPRVARDAAADFADWTYRFYLSRAHLDVPHRSNTTFGCFSYALEADASRVRLHFHPLDSEEHAPLSAQRSACRMVELTSLFNHVRIQHETVCQVAGVSWLYNLTAYTRLFPACYVASAVKVADRFRNMPRWGQFVDRHGGVRRDAAACFVERYGKCSSMSELAQCFPLQPLAVEAPLDALLVFYNRREEAP